MARIRNTRIVYLPTAQGGGAQPEPRIEMRPSAQGGGAQDSPPRYAFHYLWGGKKYVREYSGENQALIEIAKGLSSTEITLGHQVAAGPYIGQIHQHKINLAQGTITNTATGGRFELVVISADSQVPTPGFFSARLAAFATPSLPTVISTVREYNNEAQENINIALQTEQLEVIVIYGTQHHKIDLVREIVSNLETGEEYRLVSVQVGQSH